MILKEKLETMKEDEFVYIGSQSAFFFIGTVKDAKEQVNDLTNEYLYQARNRLVEESACLCKISSGEKLKQLENSIKEAERMRKYYKGEAEKIKARYDMAKDRGDADYIVSEIANLYHEEELKMHKEERKIRHYKTYIENLGKREEILRQAVDAANTYLQTYKKGMEREVREAYPRRHYGPLGTIIVVDGLETGKYWDYDEWKKMNRGDEGEEV